MCDALSQMAPKQNKYSYLNENSVHTYWSSCHFHDSEYFQEICQHKMSNIFVDSSVHLTMLQSKVVCQGKYTDKLNT